MLDKRAIGITRVSEVGDRDTNGRFLSPTIQQQKIERDCEAHTLTLLECLEELDISGGLPLAKRPALLRALELVEAGKCEAIVFAYRDRVDRSIHTNSELCRRMDAAGALLLADGQRITHSTHNGWRQATLESFLNEDQRRAISAKMLDVHIDRVARGVAPFHLPPGYRRRSDGVAEHDPVTSKLIVRAFQMRADGQSLPVIRRYLMDHGVTMSASSVGRILSNRFYLGELHYQRDGVEPNFTAHKPLIKANLFNRVQRVKGAPRGRQAKSHHLLARLGILVCGTCGSKLSIDISAGKYHFYRCKSNDCGHKMTVSASLVESIVVETMHDAVTAEAEHATLPPFGVVDRATENARNAQTALNRAEQELSDTLSVFTASGVMGEPAAVARLIQLREARDTAQATVDRIGNPRRIHISFNDWTDLSLAKQREYITGVIETVTINKGRGASRISIKLL
jgi:DNA invertase Pin-like site-specific DNA recombinase